MYSELLRMRTLTDDGEFKKRAVQEAFINVEDIIQRISKDEKGNSFLSIELPDEKYFTRMKDLFSWLDEAREDFYGLLKGDPLDWLYHTGEKKQTYEQLLLKWFGSAENTVK